MLIRFTDKKFADGYLSGELYLSSLSRFWELTKDAENLRNDFSEGVGVQVPSDIAEKFFPKDMIPVIINDLRFQIEAYKYCNLLCFFRIDTDSGIVTSAVDRRFTDLRRENPLHNSRLGYVVQNPSDKMFELGDTAVIVKNEVAFTDRVIKAVKEQGGECVCGDVRYRRIRDQMKPENRPAHSMSLRADRAYFNLKDILEHEPKCGSVYRYGCLDKYDRYKAQREWRICWLPSVLNCEPKILPVGDLSDILEIVPADGLRRRLCELYPGFYLGEVNKKRAAQTGTVRYDEFKRMVEGIDGKCNVILEIG